MYIKKYRDSDKYAFLEPLYLSLSLTSLKWRLSLFVNIYIYICFTGWSPPGPTGRQVAQSVDGVQIKIGAIYGEPEVEWCAMGPSCPRSHSSVHPLSPPPSPDPREPTSSSNHRPLGHILALGPALPDW